MIKLIKYKYKLIKKENDAKYMLNYLAAEKKPIFRILYRLSNDLKRMRF